MISEILAPKPWAAPRRTRIHAAPTELGVVCGTCGYKHHAPDGAFRIPTPRIRCQENACEVPAHSESPQRKSWLDRAGELGDIENMNRELIRQQLVGSGPVIIRTSDGKEFPVPHSEFVLVGRHNIVIEDEKGLLDIVDPLHVVSIRPAARRKTQKLGG